MKCKIPTVGTSTKRVVFAQEVHVERDGKRVRVPRSARLQGMLRLSSVTQPAIHSYVVVDVVWWDKIRLYRALVLSDARKALHKKMGKALRDTKHTPPT